jgi:acylphosphatase
VAQGRALREERLTARITGRVQGVGFRWWVRRHAEALDLTGWVMNADDERSVDLVAEGGIQALDQLERLIRNGPSGARVESVECRREPASREFDGFGIVRS